MSRVTKPRVKLVQCFPPRGVKYWAIQWPNGEIEIIVSRNLRGPGTAMTVAAKRVNKEIVSGAGSD